MNKPPMIVVHSTHTWLPVTEIWLYNSIRYLPDWIESHVVCGRRANEELFSSPRVSAEDDDWLGRIASRRLIRRALGPRQSRLRERFRTLRPQLLHSHFGYVGWRNLPLAQRYGIPHVVSFYGTDITRFPRSQTWRQRYLDVFKLADALLCEGPHMAGSIVALGCPREQVHVHHLGVSLDDIGFRPRRWVSGEPLRVLIASSFREKKAIPDALTCVALLAAEGLDVVVTVIGDAQSGSELSEKRRIEAVAATPELKGRVRFLGFQQHARLLEEAYGHHVFMSPSVTASDGDAEGGAPVSIIEMAASGMPIVATAHCDIPNVLAEPNRRILAAEHDPPALAHAVKHLMTSGWDALVHANRELVAREFDARIQGNSLARIYAGVVRPDGQGAALSRPSAVPPR